MTSPTSPEEPPDQYKKFLFYYGRVLPVLLGCAGVASIARAGFLKAEWLGWTLLGLGFFALGWLISYLTFE